ncbi:hypothetical protein ISN45_Aa01g034190 [Arabidopsis thaliana x Arabidopsis arenosa]|uniref:Uncharacterized protein n=1 Tax=Arabidopsis thaliana x Arabidopsis arenosa TaxID=1240361 RepID=A0A8T2C8S5_9BRAS|nr:hypothetical protein ISN45_Aa01g034190 [Arabidopsis thaliana x Arabidopsis arenosa]
MSAVKLCKYDLFDVPFHLSPAMCQFRSVPSSLYLDSLEYGDLLSRGDNIVLL